MYERLEGMKRPKHIAIIMDGNGRWARAKGKKRTYGHKAGSENLKQIARAASEMGIEYLTVYAFSTENWMRPKEEVSFLMTLMRQYLKDSIKNALKDNLRVKVIGRRSDMAPDIVKSMNDLEAASQACDGLNLQLAINYGGRDEIIRGIKSYIADSKKMEMPELTESIFTQYLDTKDIPDPELMIRTSGEMRSSNFLTWQLAYSEYWFIDKYWPDFSAEDLMQAIIDYNKIDRRFGGLNDEN